MKAYVKPELFFESYELNRTIAACRWDFRNNTDEKSCTAHYDQAPTQNPNTQYDEDLILFANQSCTIDEDTAKSLGYCYTNSVDDYKLFQS